MLKKTLAKQMALIPREVRWCKKCVISNQRPRIIFDENGICSACNNREIRKNIDWNKRDIELCQLLDQHRSDSGSWDVIVPSSGGKDSCYVAHKLKHEYGMNPLLVTWSPLKYTEIGLQNFNALCDELYHRCTLTETIVSLPALSRRVRGCVSCIRAWTSLLPHSYGSKV